MPQLSTVLLMAVTLTVVQSLYLSGSAATRVVHHRGPQPNKRPFCNAFTGCGRKRSQLPPLTGVSELGAAVEDAPDEESLGTLLDLSAEPAVEDLSRQIMSEAKLWEAIQEANMEIMRQRQLQTSDEHELGSPQRANSISTGGAQIKCAVPSCIAI